MNGQELVWVVWGLVAVWSGAISLVIWATSTPGTFGRRRAARYVLTCWGWPLYVVGYPLYWLWLLLHALVSSALERTNPDT